MATGDVTNLAVSASGIQATFRVEGLDYYALSGFVSEPSFAVVKEGYSGSTLGTRNHTIGCAFLSAAGFGGTTLFSDTCTEASNTALTSHTPDTDTEAAGWATNGQGTYTVLGASDKIDLTAAGASASRAWFDAGVADGVFAANIVNGSSSNRFYYLIFRYIDENNYLEVRIHSKGTAHLLRKRVAGVTTTVATASGFTATATHDWVVVLDGDNVLVFADGTSLFNETISDHNTATLMGIGNDANYLEPLFDNITFTTIPTHADVTVTLDDPINNDDTATMSMDAGGISDGTTSSNVVSAAAVTNNSTLDYPKVIGRIAGVVQGGALHVDHMVVTGTFTVEGIGGHYWHNTADGEPLERMSVTVSDGTNSLTVTTDAMEASAYADALYMATAGAAASARLGVYSVEIDPSAASPSALSAGALTVTATFYPYSGGDADSVRTQAWTIYYNPSSSLTTTNIYAAITTGNDTTGDGSTGNPYQTLRKAMDDTKGTTTTTIYNIYLKEAGTYTLAAPSVGETDNGPVVTVMPDPAGSLTAADVVIDGNADHRIRRMRLKNVTIRNAIVRGGSQTDNFAVIEGCVRTGVDGRAVDVYDASPWYQTSTYDTEGFIFNSQVTDLNQRGIQGFQFIRNCTVNTVAEDIVHGPGLCMALYGEDVEDTTGSLHVDAVQWTGTGDVNAVVYACQLYDVEGQCWFTDIAVENVLFLVSQAQQRGNTNDSSLSQFGKATSPPTQKHILLWNCTLPNQRLSWVSPGASVYHHCQMRNNIIGQYFASTAYDIDVDNTNHSVVDSGSLPDNWTSGTAGFYDGIEGAGTYDNTSRDYRLTAASACIDTMGSRVCSYDAIGNAVLSSGGALGALAGVPFLLTPSDTSTITDATPELTWEGGVANYTVQVNEEALGEVVWADPTYEATGIATTSHVVTATLAPGLYYWRVVDANGAASEVWEFTVSVNDTTDIRTIANWRNWRAWRG